MMAFGFNQLTLRRLYQYRLIFLWRVANRKRFIRHETAIGFVLVIEALCIGLAKDSNVGNRIGKKALCPNTR